MLTNGVKTIHWLSWVVILTILVTMVSENSAEAARRRRGLFFRRAAFGKRFIPAPRRRIASRVGFSSRGVQRFNNFNNLDVEALGRIAVDPFSTFSVDPLRGLGRFSSFNRGDLRLLGNSNIAFDGRGRFFEQLDPRLLTDDRPLVFKDGKILGGATVPLRDDTLEQVRILNASGALVDF
ncbi:MAG: hypothetical protein ACKOA8_06860 [Deltaproteobacteria bacterium]